MMGLFYCKKYKETKTKTKNKSTELEWYFK